MNKITLTLVTRNYDFDKSGMSVTGISGRQSHKIMASVVGHDERRKTRYSLLRKASPLVAVVILILIQQLRTSANVGVAEHFRGVLVESSEEQGPLPFLPPESDFRYCEMHNIVADRNDSSVEHTLHNSRPFSLRKDNFQRFHGRYCATVKELLDAIRLGTRQWDDEVTARNLSILEREMIPSIFVPYGCDVPVHSPAEMCEEIMNQFSHVIIRGDSLSRHLNNGLLVTLRNDIVQGGIWSSKLPAYRCRCDGQFSEHGDCRTNDGLFQRFKPYQLGMCSQLDVEDQFEQRYLFNGLNLEGINCSSPENKRGVLAIIQGGTHFQWKASQAWKHIIEVFLEDPIIHDCAE